VTATPYEQAVVTLNNEALRHALGDHSYSRYSVVDGDQTAEDAAVLNPFG
jgi:hypothetical protein